MINAKVKVTKEVAEAIERIKGSLMTVGTLINTVDGTWELRGRDAIVVQHLTKEEAISAIFYGYEVEQTPAEKVAEYYRTSKAYERCCEYRRGKAEAIEFVAKAYGLTIEGVNV